MEEPSPYADTGPGRHSDFRTMCGDNSPIFLDCFCVSSVQFLSEQISEPISGDVFSHAQTFLWRTSALFGADRQSGSASYCGDTPPPHPFKSMEEWTKCTHRASHKRRELEKEHILSTIILGSIII